MADSPIAAMAATARLASRRRWMTLASSSPRRRTASPCTHTRISSAVPPARTTLSTSAISPAYVARIVIRSDQAVSLSATISAILSRFHRGPRRSGSAGSRCRHDRRALSVRGDGLPSTPVHPVRPGPSVVPRHRGPHTLERGLRSQRGPLGNALPGIRENAMLSVAVVQPGAGDSRWFGRPRWRRMIAPGLFLCRIPPVVSFVLHYGRGDWNGLHRLALRPVR